MSDRWRETYDAWKLATPPEYEQAEEDGERDEIEELAYELLAATNREKRLLEALKPFVDAFLAKTIPGDSDLDNEQPYHITVTLGDLRRARSVVRA